MLRTQLQVKLCFKQVFFFNSLSPWYLFTVGLFFSFFLMWCGGAPGYFPRPPTATLSSPFPFFWTTQHEYNNTQHPWEAPIRPGIRTLLISRWCRKSVALPSPTLPSAPDRHTHIHGPATDCPAEVPSFEKILPLRWDLNPLAPGA
jgi:hypothetical protein